jgi:tetratricopeptide (TPR) repeat protein
VAAWLLALLAALALSSCGAAMEKRRAEAFGASLAQLDFLLAAQSLPKLEAAFAKAYSLARGSGEWLSLLKRGRSAEAAGEGGRYASTADRARKALPKSEAVAASAAHAYLRSGRSVEALALFGGALSPSARPSLWAEAFILSAQASTSGQASSAPVPRSEDYGRLAEITGDARVLLGAAVISLAAGDKVAAASWLRKGLVAGAEPSPALLWDAGLYEELASLPDGAAGAEGLATMGDAAWAVGDPDLAKRRWGSSVSLSPRRSWKPYADLALASGRETEAEASYWARLKAAFLSAPASSARDEALAAYVAYLAREGRDAEALAALKGSSPAPGGAVAGSLALMAAIIEGRALSEGRYVAELERLAAERPDDTRIMGAVLRELLARGLFEEVEVLERSAARRGLRLEYGWFFEAAVLAARGDSAAAYAAIAGAGRDAGTAGTYALGGLLADMGKHAEAATAYSRAASAASSGRERCAAYKALGRELGDTGDARGASLAYRAAAAADPADAEAAALARGTAAERSRK